MATLDSVQRRAAQLINNAQQKEGEAATTDVTLNHSLDASALTVFHKAQLQQVQHLQRLTLPVGKSQRSTTAVLSSECC